VAFTSLAGLTLGLILIGKLDGNPIGHFSIVRMGGCFVAGAALCRTWRMAPALPRLWIGGLSWCACLGIVMSCTVPKTAIFALFSLAALVFALAFQQGLVNRVLASKPLVFLGKISFPLYLVHAVPLLWWGYWFHPTGAAAIVLIVADIASCFLAATLLHFTIERPAHALGRRWTDHAIYRIAESPQKV
jgi:peptidoglycan/LPS O-acetylase OafA/YrhL